MRQNNMALRLLWLAVPCLAFVQRPPPVARSAVSRRQTIRAAASTLDDKDVSELLSGAEYAMDISSITAGSEKETYIGQGSGVNEGAGVGKLAGWAKKAVGKLLTWRNTPVYNDLWDIIENDCLAVVKERVPELEMRRTWFSDEVAPYSFATDDGQCEGTVAGYKGGRVDWITTCKFFSKALGFGNMRIDGWTTRDTRAPHVAVHLCIVFNVLFIYITLVPRTNLVLDDEYNDYVYGDPSKRTGKSLNDYHVQCVEDKAFKQYISKSHVVNAFMVAPTTLLYTVKHNKKNFEKVRTLSRDYINIWLDMLEEQDGVFFKGIDTKETQATLLQTDVRTRQFCGRDPDTKNVANIFGLELTDKLVRTLWGDPDDPVWQSR